MNSFLEWALLELKKRNEERKRETKLLQVSDLVDWERIRVHLESMYDNRSERGGRPNCDVILMFRVLVLQQWYNLSDMEAERQIADRISFMEFLGWPDEIPDSRTIWLFRERLVRTGMYDVVWEEFQSQIDSMGLKVISGTVQDATFIEADPGNSKKPRGDDAKTRRSRDGTWAKKGNEIHFGYKLHQKTDLDYNLIRDVETSTASLHDSQIDLSTEHEIVFRDRGYFGAEAKGIDYTMKRKPPRKPLGEFDKEYNHWISRIRAPCERPHAVIKRVFNAGIVLVTTVKRVHVKMVVTAIAYNLYQLCTLKKASII